MAEQAICAECRTRCFAGIGRVYKNIGVKMKSFLYEMTRPEIEAALVRGVNTAVLTLIASVEEP